MSHLNHQGAFQKLGVKGVFQSLIHVKCLKKQKAGGLIPPDGSDLAQTVVTPQMKKVHLCVRRREE